jgi:hypothetical protein
MPFPLLALLALGGSGLKAGGQILQAFGANEESQAEQRRLRALAAIDLHVAGQARVQGNEQAGRALTEGSKAESQIKVGFAAGGIDPTTGTTADNQADVRTWAQSDARQLQLNAAMKARGLERQAADAKQQAEQIGAAQKRANIGAALGIAGSIASSVGSVGQQFPDLLGGGGLPASGAAPAPAAQSQGLSVSDSARSQGLPLTGGGRPLREPFGGGQQHPDSRYKLWDDLWDGGFS